MVNRWDNYNVPINYVCAAMPDDDICRRIRIEGCPSNCKIYSVAFKVNNDGSAGETIYGWPGYSFDCPIVPYWDKEGPWSILQTEILTKE